MARIQCPACAHCNSPNAHFCGFCGTSLAEATSINGEQADLENPQDLRKILAITNAINSTLNLDEVLNLVLDFTVEITQGQRGFLILRGDDKTLQFKVARNIDQKELGENRYAISRRALQMAMEKGEIVATVSAQQDSIFATSKSVFDLDLQTIVCIPLKSSRSAVPIAGEATRAAIIGAIYIDSQLPVRYFTAHKQSLIEVLANSAAIAIENARLYRELDQQKSTIQEAASNLEIMVKERTEELDHKNQELLATIEELRRLQSQLVQSEKMATIGILAGGVAHEINNPLGSILSNSQRILRHACSETRHKVSAELAQEGARRCQAIVQNLLAFSRQSDSTLKSLNLNEVLDGTLGLLDHHLSTMGIHIEKDYGPVPSVFANHNELSQVFTNLLVNAKDSTSETLSKEKTFGTIQIRTYGDGKNAVVEIRDDGKGISPENMRKLFDPFFTTKEIGKGTGLGLYISLGIVQRLGGKIEAESKLGEGALFRVSLPALNEPAS